jgi:hypothetical protein
MRRLLLSAAIVGVVWGDLVPVMASPLTMSGFNNPNIEAVPVERVGYGRRHWRRGYPEPYAYYPPAYGYYVPPPAYTYVPAYRYFGSAGIQLPSPLRADLFPDSSKAWHPAPRTTQRSTGPFICVKV